LRSACNLEDLEGFLEEGRGKKELELGRKDDNKTI